MRNLHKTSYLKLGYFFPNAGAKASAMSFGLNTGHYFQFNHHYIKMKNTLACAAGLLAIALAVVSSPVYGQSIAEGKSHSQAVKAGLFPDETVQMVYKATSPGYFDDHAGSVTWSSDGRGGMTITHATWREETPTPFNFTFDYLLSKDSNKGYLMDIEGLMSPFYFMVNEAVKISYHGDRVHFPASFQSGQMLPDAKGVFHLEIGNGIPSINYEVSVSDRKVVAGETIVIAGQPYETFLHTCQVATSKLIDGQRIAEPDLDIVKDWFVPGIGIVKRETLKFTATTQTIKQNSDK